MYNGENSTFNLYETKVKQLQTLESMALYYTGNGTLGNLYYRGFSLLYVNVNMGPTIGGEFNQIILTQNDKRPGCNY